MANNIDAEDDGEAETVVTAVEVREELQASNETARRKITETRDVITALEDRVSFFGEPEMILGNLFLTG